MTKNIFNYCKYIILVVNKDAKNFKGKTYLLEFQQLIKT